MRRVTLKAEVRPQGMYPLGDFPYSTSHHCASRHGMASLGASGDSAGSHGLPQVRFARGGGGRLKGKVIA